MITKIQWPTVVVVAIFAALVGVFSCWATPTMQDAVKIAVPGVMGLIIAGAMKAMFGAASPPQPPLPPSPPAGGPGPSITFTPGTGGTGATTPPQGTSSWQVLQARGLPSGGIEARVDGGSWRKVQRGLANLWRFECVAFAVLLTLFPPDLSETALLVGCKNAPSPETAGLLADASCDLVEAFDKNNFVESVCAHADELAQMAALIAQSRASQPDAGMPTGRRAPCDPLPKTAMCVTNDERLAAIRAVVSHRSDR